MKDQDCVALLQWTLPRLRMRWNGFRRVRRQVCRRIHQRIRELGLDDPLAYRPYLEAHPEEWPLLDGLCRITISRFYRDRAVFDELVREIVPALAEAALTRGESRLRAWSAGCASGEEAYSLVIAWKLGLEARFASLAIDVVGTDIDEELLERAHQACYPASSLRELPAAWTWVAFDRSGSRYCLRPEFRERASFRLEDIRRSLPPESFHLVLCRNLVFTYFEPTLQQELSDQISGLLLPGGVLIIGVHEALPAGARNLAPWGRSRAIFRKAGE